MTEYLFPAHVLLPYAAIQSEVYIKQKKSKCIRSLQPTTLKLNWTASTGLFADVAGLVAIIAGFDVLKLPRLVLWLKTFVHFFTAF